MKHLYLLSSLSILLSCSHHKNNTNETVNNEAFEKPNPIHLIHDIKAIENDLVNVVIEIPTGSIEKWEVNKTTGELEWQKVNGKPRKVNYLGYPGNYGMIPQTILPKKIGGDGDPLDVIVLGPAVQRGNIIKTKLIGVLKVLDRGEQDDKLIAVMEKTNFYEINTLTELNNEYKGITEIIKTFFSNYKGKGKMEFVGFGDEKEAKKVLGQAINSYQELY